MAARYLTGSDTFVPKATSMVHCVTTHGLALRFLVRSHITAGQIVGLTEDAEAVPWVSGLPEVVLASRDYAPGQVIFVWADAEGRNRDREVAE